MATFRNVLAGTGAAVLLSACAAVGPDFEKPEAPVADNWLDSDNPSVDTSSSAYQDWWEVFEDPVLSNLISTAYAQNLSLEIAGLRVMEARAQLGIATGLKYPQSQSISGGYTSSRSSINAPPLSNLPDDVSSQVDRSAGVWSAFRAASRKRYSARRDFAFSVSNRKVPDIDSNTVRPS